MEDPSSGFPLHGVAMRRLTLSASSIRLATLALVLFANAYSMANPFPYSPFLVLHFGLADDERSVGFFAGFVISAFMLGRIVGSFPLGTLSDTWGRRPVIEIGLLVSCIGFQSAFGLSPTFGSALLFRFLMGVTNGIIGVSKAWLPELAPPSHQAIAMSVISGMWCALAASEPALSRRPDGDWLRHDAAWNWLPDGAKWRWPQTWLSVEMHPSSAC